MLYERITILALLFSISGVAYASTLSERLETVGTTEPTPEDAASLSFSASRVVPPAVPEVLEQADRDKDDIEEPVAQEESDEQSPNVEIAEALVVAEEYQETEDMDVVVERTALRETTQSVATVPFYSQFDDISSPAWKKVGCGIASLAMLIEYYAPDSVSVDALLREGIDAGAYLDDAGWIHQGLINLSGSYGLFGASFDMAGMGMTAAFTRLEEVLAVGPVMVSVHYTFDPTSTIPHLVVVNGVKDGLVYYNDPSEKSGGGTISIQKFKNAWKKRYIELRPRI